MSVCYYLMMTDTLFSCEQAPQSQTGSLTRMPSYKDVSVQIVKPGVGQSSRSNSAKIVTDPLGGTGAGPPLTASNKSNRLFKMQLPTVLRPRLSSIRQSSDEENIMDAVTALHASQARPPTGREFLIKKDVPALKITTTGPVNTSLQSSPRARKGPRLGSLDNGRPAVLERRKSTTDYPHDVELGQSDDAHFDATEKVPKIFLLEYNTNVWDVDRDIVDLRHLVNASFRQQWDKGIHAYIKGDWQKARDIFHETVKLPCGGEDGPSKFLITVIDDNGGTKPPTWQEYRQEGPSGH